MGRIAARFALSDRLSGTWRSKHTAAACIAAFSRPEPARFPALSGGGRPSDQGRGTPNVEFTYPVPSPYRLVSRVRLAMTSAPTALRPSAARAGRPADERLNLGSSIPFF